MVWIRYFACYFCLLLSLHCTGQDAISGFKNFRSLTTDDGLKSNAINCFAKDSSGFMWMATDNGLVRYDGSDKVIYQNIEGDTTSISGNNITDIQMEGDSILWVATNKNGLSKFHFETEKFTRYLPDVSDATSLPSEEILTLDLDSKGELWIGFLKAGFCKYNRESDSFTSYEVPEPEESKTTRQNNIILKFIFDNRDSNIIWIVALRSLIKFEIKTASFSFYNPYEKLPESKEIKLFNMRKGIQTDDGKIYVTFGRYGVWAFDPSDKSWKNYSLKEYDSVNRLENSYNLIQQKDERTFWLSSGYQGIYLLNLDEGFIKPLQSCDENEAEALCTQKIFAMNMLEPEGYWIGTNNGMRLYNKRGNQFDVFIHQIDMDLLKTRSSISALYQADSNGVYYGGYAGEGVYYFNFKTESKTLIPPPAEYAVGSKEEMFYTRTILPYGDSLALVLSENALFKLNTKRKRLAKVDIGLEYRKDYYNLHRIFHHTNGNYYLSTRHNGIYILNPELDCIGQLKYDINNPNSLISPNYIYEICEDPMQRLWIGTEDGFSVYDPETKIFDNFDYKQRLDSVPQLKIIFKILCAPDSSIWIIDGQSNGVSIKYPYTKPYHFEPIATGGNGIADRLNNVLFSKTGKTFISTEAGLSIAANGSKIIRFNEKEGLPILHPLGPLLETENGDVFIGTGNQLIYFNPNSLYTIQKKSPLYLTALSIFNEKLKINMDSLQKTGLSLNYLQNFFTLSLSSLNFDNPEEYKLSYRLSGLNDSWITNDEKNAVFTNIPGGNYTFEARLLDKNSLPQKDLFKFPIEIIPPFWKTWWFSVLLIAAFLSIVSAFYVVRVRSIRREALLTTTFNKQIANMELTSLRAQMNPHFLFNSLNSIRHQIISNKKVEADRYLLKFSRLVRLILNNSRQQIIPLKDELEALALYIELESSRFDHKFSHQLKIDESIDIERLKIPPILIQPYVENAIWHGLMQKPEPGEVIIDVEMTDINLIIKIQDNGIGRDASKELKSKTAEKRQSMGMEITGNRLEIIEKIYNIKCRAEITDLKNPEGIPTGTLVILTLPLIYED